MTRDDIVSLVTSTVGQTDAASVTLCNSFVQRAYEMVWNAELWRDTVTIDTTPTVSQGTNTFNLPANYDRIISLQLLSGGAPVGFLEPTSSTFILQTEPMALTVQGVPTKYEEFVHTDGVRKIRLFPVPNASYTLTLSGKRTCPTLGASDSLQIRNVDNAVVALATVDMYTRQRQLGKAAELAKKAGAFIDEARQIEKTQSNLPRVAKTTTVSGDSLAELVDAVCEKTGVWDLGSVIQIKGFLRRNYLRIYDAYLWPESKVRITKASDGGYIILPSEIAQVLKVRNATGQPAIDVVDESLYFDIAPGIFEETASQPIAFSVMTPIGATTLPASAEKLQVVSSSAADKGNVFIRGETATGSVFYENLTLNGTTPVAMASMLLVPLTISKGITTGTITVTGYSSATTYQTLLPAEREKKHIRLMVQPANPGVASTCMILGKRKIAPLVADEDTPIIRGIGDALINAAAADLLRSKGSPDQAASYLADSQRAVQSLIDQFTQQAAYSQRVVPTVESCGWDCEYSDAWIVAKI